MQANEESRAKDNGKGKENVKPTTPRHEKQKSHRSVDDDPATLSPVSRKKVGAGYIRLARADSIK